eukprot:Tbor_TRINITY_DN2871_c0_g1::TRINITY_DN2871_c0_g1_i1::g.23165::m.23165
MLVILGGSCFMGRHLVKAAKEGYGGYPDVPTIAINRGRPYWALTGESDELYNPIYHVEGDRSDHASMETAMSTVRGILLSQGSLNDKPPYITICDFSCDDDTDMDGVWAAIESKLLLSSAQYPAAVSNIQYILISSDSVYESKYVPIGVTEGHSTCSRNAPGYSGEKRRCELALEKAIISFTPTCSVSGVCLRLPDVLGEFDRSGRLWAPLLWAQSGIPLIISEKIARSRQLCSFVYAGDVAHVVLKLHRRMLFSVAQQPQPLVSYYNIACVERVTISGFLQLVISSAEKELRSPIKTITISTCRIPDDSSSQSSSDDTDCDMEKVEDFSCDYYPSVMCGALNIEKIQQEFQFTPISLTEAVSRSVRFFFEYSHHLNSKSKTSKSGIVSSIAEYRCALKKLPLFVRTVVQHSVE